MSLGEGIFPQRECLYFAAIRSLSVKTVAGRTDLLLIITSTGDELSGDIKIDNLEQFRTLKL